MGKLCMPGKKAKKYLERDGTAISPSYSRAYQFMMDHGMSSEIWGVDGNRFIDFAVGIAVCSTGHSYPKVVEAAKQQSDRFLHISSDFYHPIWIEFSERLTSTAPFKEPAKICLGNSGTEAVEAAIKPARYHSGRQQFTGSYGSFHGRTIGALAFTARKPVYRHSFLPLMNGVTHVPFPDPYRPILSSQNATEVGEYTLDALCEIQVRHPSIGQVRRKGLMIGVEFAEDRQTRKPAYNLRDRVLEQAFQHGLLTLGCGESAIRIYPPLNISRDLIDEGLEILEAAINDAEEEGLD